MLISHQPRANRQSMGIARIWRANWVNAICHRQSKI